MSSASPAVDAPRRVEVADGTTWRGRGIDGWQNAAMARIHLGAALLAVCLLVSACGKGSGPASKPLSTTGSAVSKPSPGRPAKAQAADFARAVNLRATDVPGFRVSPRKRGKTAREGRLGAELRRCVGVAGAAGNGTPLAEAASPDFARNRALSELSVSSSVSVSRNAGEAASELRKLHSPRTKSCLARYFGLLLAGSASAGRRLGPISVMLGDPPAAGMAGSFGVRLTTSIDVRSLQIPLEFDILGFVDGASVVSLFSSGVPVAFPAAAEQHLFLLLLERARANRP